MLHSAIRHEALTYGRQPGELNMEQVVREHGPLVRRQAWRVHSGMSSAVELEDLVQIGLIALIEAARTFEERGAAFAPYAATRVRGAMIDHLRRHARTGRLASANRRRLAAARGRLETELGRAATDAELASAMGLSVDAYHAMVLAAAPVEQDSIDEVYADDSLWFADQAETADLRLEREQLQSAMTGAIGELPEREQLVLQLYFVEELNLEEIGAVLNVGAARVCQIKKAALARLRGKVER